MCIYVIHLNIVKFHPHGHPVTEEFVLRIVKSGPTKPHCFLRTLTSSHQPSQISSTHTTGIVPHDLKTGIVKPLMKKPLMDRNLNYQLISNLPFPSRILEKVVLHWLLSHLQVNNFCNAFQTAYWAVHITKTILLHAVHKTLFTVWTRHSLQCGQDILYSVDKTFFTFSQPVEQYTSARPFCLNFNILCLRIDGR